MSNCLNMNNTNIYSNLSCSYYCCKRMLSFILLSPLTPDFFFKEQFREGCENVHFVLLLLFFRPIFIWNYLMQCLFVILVIQAKTRNNTFSGSRYCNLAAFASITDPSGKINFTATVRGEVLAMVKHISRPSTCLH